MTSYYILSGKSWPLIISDEHGSPLEFETAEEAHSYASSILACEAYGYAVIEWSGGYLRAVDQ